MNKIGRFSYGAGLAVGAAILLFTGSLWGAGIMFLGIVIYVASEPSIGSERSYSTETEKKPYYKNDYEEYKHYKHCKKHMRG